MIKTSAIIICLDMLTVSTLSAQNTVTDQRKKRQAGLKAFSIRGYIQARYNRLLETNAQLKNEQGDKSWGADGGFFLRRVRIILIWSSVQECLFLSPT
jgi:hypothetical protein